MKTGVRIAVLIVLALSLIGCAAPHHIYYGNLLYKNSPDKTCCYQAELYAEFLSLEGAGEVKIYTSGEHAFCVRDGKMYDSTNMECTGLSVDHPKVKRVYGDKEGWVCIATIVE